MKNTSELVSKTYALISDLKPALKSIIKDSESGFIKLGKDLQSVYDDTDKLKRMTVESAGLIGEGSENTGALLSGIRSFTNDSMEELDAFRNNVSEIFPRFESCLNNIDKLHNTCPDIIKISKTLNIVALNISVESSRTRTSEEMFNIFVKEIRELAKRVGDIAHMIKEDSERATSGRDNDFNGILKEMNQIDKMADEAGETVSENIKSIDEIMNMSLDALKELERHSNRISGLVGDVVMAIQFHDIARQQIEHVMEAFQDMECTTREREASIPSKEEDVDILSKAASLTHLQCLQMMQILSEIKDARNKITISFKDIGKEAEYLVAGVGNLGAGDMEAGTRESALKLLLSGFKRLEIIMANGESLSEKIDRAVRHTGVIAANISGYLSSMQEIGMDLHIKSVNALLMSKKLGHEGLALSVLAQHVTDVSKGSDYFVGEVIEILKRIQGLALELQEISNRKDAGQEGGGKLIAGRVSLITGTYDRFIRETEEARRHSMRLKERLFSVESSLAFLDRMESGVEDCIKEMSDLETELSPYRIKEKNATDLNKLKGRYTMEVERNIHRMSLDMEDNVPDNDATERDSDGLGDNVELF